MCGIELASRVLEAVRMGEYADCEEWAFCRAMADTYGCKPLKADAANFDRFLCTLFHYGKIEGKREERAGKRRVNVSYSDIVAALASRPDLKAFLGNTIKNGRQYVKCATAYLMGKTCSMRLKDIQIYPCYEERPPKPEKMERKEKYFEKAGRFQSEIVLDKDGYLINGYTSYLLARRRGMRRVPVRYGKRQIIKAYHKEGGKLYEWELPQSMIDRVSAGDKALVFTKDGVGTVTVAAVEPYKPQEHTRNLRTAIRRRKGVLHNGMA